MEHVLLDEQIELSLHGTPFTEHVPFIVHERVP